MIIFWSNKHEISQNWFQTKNKYMSLCPDYAIKLITYIYICHCTQHLWQNWARLYCFCCQSDRCNVSQFFPESTAWWSCLPEGHKARPKSLQSEGQKLCRVGSHEISPDFGRNISNLELDMRNIMGRYELCTRKLGNWAATMTGNHGFSKADERERNARRWKLCTSLYIFLGGPAKCIHLII